LYGCYDAQASRTDDVAADHADDPADHEGMMPAMMIVVVAVPMVVLMMRGESHAKFRKTS